MKLLIQIFLTSLIIVKIVLGSIFLYEIRFTSLFTGTIAIASELPKNPEVAAEPARHSEASARAGVKKTIYSSFLRKKDELEKKEKYLEKRKIQLIALQEEINNKIAALTRLRNEIRAEMAAKKTGEDRKLKHLIKIYSAMKPQKAASLIEKLDLKLVIELFSRMKGDIVGDILSFVDIEKAAKISEGLL
ncbi:MAG: hypothetical protein BA864_09225, partial [Desulfuromonadales bacterium C00003093]